MQVKPSGYQWQHAKQVLTVFSAPRYPLGSNGPNLGAYLVLHGDTDGLRFDVQQFDCDGEAREDSGMTEVPEGAGDGNAAADGDDGDSGSEGDETGSDSSDEDADEDEVQSGVQPHPHV